jgi:nucleoporin NUP82
MASNYDISVDAEEPLQVISFVPDRRRSSKTFNAIDSAEREVASFTLGKGMADWGPLTIYALMKNRYMYAVCPYMPKNAYVTLKFNTVLSWAPYVGQYLHHTFTPLSAS